MLATNQRLSRPISFSSDNVTGVQPQILQALQDCNSGMAAPYGHDDYTAACEARLSALFECDVSLFLVPTGTAANALSLSVLCPPWGAVLCHPDSHINNDECGAPEFYTHGAKIIGIGGADSKIDPQQLALRAGVKKQDVHSVQPAVVSVTQATETGSVYTLDELQQISGVCREHGLRLHMDGARFANALVALDCTPAEMTWKLGVDALSFGATKNGVLAAEAILLFDAGLAQEMGYRRKRAGHLFSKMRFMSAQMLAYLEEDLWLNNARHSNAMAARLGAELGAIEGIELCGEVAANILFCKMPQALSAALIEQGFQFYSDRWAPGVVRLVTSFMTREEEVTALVEACRCWFDNQAILGSS
ncbi:threonine aldolase family protein [Neptuniibacter halophilus]|uniref:threonine aldolase family protein n=1 Tax=Neptuniibacter halophilus TaxID=651666 RepID=UPI00257475A9|nr:low specificity L-threonine aldolase [Neptuniibacter halophilus]